MEKLFGVTKPKKEIVADIQRMSVNQVNFSGQGNPFKDSSVNMPSQTDLGNHSSSLSPSSLSSKSQSTTTGVRTANATGSGRNKVALKPGHSLMDWIRLTNSGQDFTCGSQGMKRVGGLELQQHNKQDDAWTAINGVVYNITTYMDFHPGGVNELERAAGHDSTDLFNQIHSWVNFESMLQKCRVGRLVMDKHVLKAKLDPLDSNQNEKDGKEKKTALLPPLPTFANSIAHPTYRWSDEKNSFRLVVNTRTQDVQCPSFYLRVTDNQEFDATFKLVQKYIYRVHLQLQDKIQSDKLESEFEILIANLDFLILN